MVKKRLYHLVQGLLVLAFLMSGVSKLFSNLTQIRETYTDPLGYAPWFIYGIGVLETIAALGLIAGFRWRRLAAGSALAIAVILIGAIVSHLAANAAAGAILPAVYLVLVALLLSRLIGQESVLKLSRSPIETTRA